MDMFDSEIKNGQRFEFGKNWRSFLSTLTDERISAAENSIVEMIKLNNLEDKRFLDIGSGSGLFSLAARKRGADVCSFDYDPESVACTRELRTRYFPNDPKWVVKEGSVLDKEFLRTIGSFDIVYSWGVLHHTGDMWTALENTASLVKKKGFLFIAIYNDQGIKSEFWRKVKRLFCSGLWGKAIVSGIFIPPFLLISLTACAIKRENVFTNYKKKRGMSIVHDWIDWLGGFPFEVARVEEIFYFFRNRGFVLMEIRITNGLGNNQFLFVRESEG